MHWYLIGPLFLVLATQLLVISSAEAVKRDAELGDREKRIPYFYPMRRSPYEQELEEEEEENNSFDRKRRTPFYYASPRLWKSMRNLEEEEEENELDNEDEGFDRKRRIPYFYPHHSYGNRPSQEDLEELEEKRSLKKRGNPYYYPSLSYNFLARPDEAARKRYSDWKRSLKRSLSDALEHDDVTDFGYDKRQPMDENEDEESKKKKKRVVVKKSG